MTEDLTKVAERWVGALNRHDLEAAVDCFAPDYRDEAPARRGEFVEGRPKIRENLARLLGDVADLRAELLGAVADDHTVWIEWRMSGTRRGGSRMEFVGVNLFGVDNGRFRWGRIYTELVRNAGDVDAQIERMTQGTALAPSGEDLVREMFDAYAKADGRRLRETMDPEVVYHVPGRSPMAGDYRGREEVLALWDRQKQYMGGQPYRVKQLATVAGGNYVVLLTEVTAQRSGRSMTFQGANVYRISHGRVAEARVFIFDLNSFDGFWAQMPPREPERKEPLA